MDISKKGDSIEQEPIQFKAGLFSFKMVTKEKLAKPIHAIKPSAFADDVCPAWFIKNNRECLLDDLCKIVNASLQSGILPTQLKHALLTSLLKKPKLNHLDWDNYRPISAICFWLS